MTTEKYNEWVEANAVKTEVYWANGIEYIFATLKDGWIGIFEKTRYQGIKVLFR